MVELKFDAVFCKSIMLDIQESHKKCARLKCNVVSYWCHNTNAEEKLTVMLFLVLFEGSTGQWTKRIVDKNG